MPVETESFPRAGQRAASPGIKSGNSGEKRGNHEFIQTQGHLVHRSHIRMPDYCRGSDSRLTMQSFPITGEGVLSQTLLWQTPFSEMPA